MATSDYYIQDNSDIEDKKLGAAKGLYQAGNYSGALKLYLDMVNTGYSYKLNYEIGRCYNRLNQIDTALEYFLNSVSLESYKNPSYSFIGNIYSKKGNLEKAIEYWSTAFAYKPDDEAVCLNLATSYFSKNMKFHSVFFYQKYLQYAKDKTSSYYLDIKKSMSEFEKLGNEFYQKALTALKNQDNQTAVQALEYAINYLPTNFDINFLLAKVLMEDKMYLQALVYMKQAFVIDKKSLDVLQRLASIMIALGDFTGAYCCFKRILPLVINNQKEYLDVIQTIKRLEESFDGFSYQAHKDWADKYYEDNNYVLALMEYENCLIINPSMAQNLENRVEMLKMFLNPEERIIRLCMEKGNVFHSAGDYKKSNKYFSRILALSTADSYDYTIAKSRIVNV